MTNENNFIAIIPARGGSKGLKNKNILKINSIPLIAYSIKAAKKSKKIIDVYVSTDSSRIAKVSKKYGAKVIKRPKYLSSDKAKQDDVIKHAIKKINTINNIQLQNIVLLQATSPIREKEDIDNCISLFEKTNHDCVFSSVKLDICLWRKEKKIIKPINFKVEKRGNRQLAPIDLVENGSIYVSKTKAYFTKRMRFGKSCDTYQMKSFTIFEIDNFEEFKIIEMMINSKDKLLKDIVR